MRKKCVILIGDSITQGLGSKKINFTNELQYLIGDKYIVENMALTGTTIYYANQILPKILAKNPSYVVIVYGNVDAQIRPSSTGRIFQHLPKRFQGNGMLMPRPFYSHNLKKKIAQKIENAIRFLYRNLIYSIDGAEQWVSIEDFSDMYIHILEELTKNRVVAITCSTVFIDRKKFPGTLEQYRKFNSSIKNMAEENAFEFVDLFTPLMKAVDLEGWKSIYCFDHFHPNEGGYKIIAKEISKKILECGFNGKAS